MNIRELLKKGTDILKQACIDTPAFDAGVLLCHVLGRDRVFLYSHDDFEPGKAEIEAYLELIDERARRKPLQYIIGCQEFMSLPFEVGPGVLVPRQDTEVLVETVLEHMISVGRASARVLDIGTGSGCIAVSLAYYSPACRVTAVDISPAAVAIAGRNAVRNGVDGRVEFIEGDMFQNLPLPEEGLYDIIVSNPPYIPQRELEELQAEVRDYEPRGALDGGSDGLCCYRRITAEAVNLLKPHGLLAFEVGYGQAEQVLEMMKEFFYGLQIERDLSGVNRVVSGRLMDGAGSRHGRTGGSKTVFGDQESE